MKEGAILKQYIQSIAKYPRITPEEEIDLGRKIITGDTLALNKMVNSNLKLVVKISLEMCKGNSSVMDVIQNGNIGLIRAAKKFNPERGVRFSTYSAFWIKQSIMRGFIKPSLSVSISYRKDEINKKIKHFVKDYYIDNGHLPQVDEIIKILNVKRRDVIDVILLFRTNGEYSSSFSSNTSEEAIEAVQDNRMNPEMVVENNLMIRDVLNAVDTFPKRESDIIKSRFGFNQDNKETLQELGKKYSISAEATRQIERKVLTMMRVKFPALAYYFYAA